MGQGQGAWGGGVSSGSFTQPSGAESLYCACENAQEQRTIPLACIEPDVIFSHTQERVGESELESEYWILSKY